MRRLIVLIAAASLMPTAAMADRPKSDDMGKSDRLICKTIPVIGSRLNKQRTCHTSAEWAEMRREQRFTTERVQALKPQIGQ